MLSQTTIMRLARLHEISMERVCQIADICEKHGLKPNGNVFRRKPEDIEEIVRLCRENNIDPEQNRNVFGKSASTIRRIIEICNENNVPLESHIFVSKPEDLQASAEYIRQHYGEIYIHAGTITNKVENLKETMPIVRILGLLPYTRMDGSIFSLTKDELLERAGVLIHYGIPLHKRNDVLAVDRVNKVFTLSKESWEEYCQQHIINELVREQSKRRVIQMIKSAIAQSRKNVK